MGEGIEHFLNQVIVLDTNTHWLYVGTLKEIGDAFGGISPSAVTQNTRRVNQRRKEDNNFKQLVEEAEKTIFPKHQK